MLIDMNIGCVSNTAYILSCLNIFVLFYICITIYNLISFHS